MGQLKRNIYIILVAVLVLGYGVLAASVYDDLSDVRIQKSQEYLYRANKSSNEDEKMLLLEQAVVLHPTEETLLAAGIAALNRGDNSLAGKYLGRVRTAEGYYQLATAYYNLAKYDLAATYYQKSLDKKASSAAYLGLGKSYLKMGEVDQAGIALARSEDSEKLADILAVSSGDEAAAAYNALNALGYPQSAKIVLQRATDSNQVSRDGLITLADSHIQAGEYQAAYDLLTRARAMDAYYPQIYNHLLLVAGKLGKADEASKYQEFYNRLSF